MRKILLLFTALTLSIGLWAVDNIPYVDAYGQEQTVDNVTEITSSTEVVILTEGWYVVRGTDVQLAKGAACQGTVHLILADGAKLTATGVSVESYDNTAGIQVSGEGNRLNIYGQTAQTGQLIATGGVGSAGIGGGWDMPGSRIAINGGKIIAEGKDGAAGIGGGKWKSGSNITINGGEVKAIGSEDGAGIGGGVLGGGSSIFINGGKVDAQGGNYAAGIGGGSQGGSTFIDVYGGEVTATGGFHGAGIGAGSLGSCSYITINGGKVKAIGGEDGAGIGGGKEGDGNDITISGGVVEAIGGDNAAGIGGGLEYSGYNITISGGEVIATGGKGAAGIGGGYKGIASIIHIQEANVTANGSNAASAIGNGAESSIPASDIQIPVSCLIKADGNNPPIMVIENDGSDLAAKLAGKQYATIENLLISVRYIDEHGIEQETAACRIPSSNTVATWTESWYVVNATDVQLTKGAVCQGDIHLILADGATLTAKGDDSKAGIQVSGEGNRLSIYGQAAQTGQLIAMGGKLGAGIGGGLSKDGHHITINGGKVTTTGGKMGAGIGGGQGANGSDITINGGTVIANGGLGSAGIGGGLGAFDETIEFDGGYGFDITITGGEVTATGGEEYGAGIGGGYTKSGYNITISGGKVTAIGGEGAAAIGGAKKAAGHDITISRGEVTATGGEAAAGIGGGEGGEGSNITIGDAKVKATGGNNAAAIGGGDKANGSHISITAGTIIANGGINASAIGGGAKGKGSDIIISKYFLTRADNYNPPTTLLINTGSDMAGQLADKRYVTVTPNQEPIIVSTPYVDEYGKLNYVDACVVVDNGSLTSWGKEHQTTWYVVRDADVHLLAGANCVGDVRMILADGAKLTVDGIYEAIEIIGDHGSNYFTIYGQTAQTGQLIANGGENGAGIGGGYYQYGSSITINGGTIIANGGDGASAIGGGWGQNGFDITINGGTIIANGGQGASAIGSGVDAEYESVNIYISDAYVLKAGSTADPTTIIKHSSAQDMAETLKQKQYVTIEGLATPYTRSMSVGSWATVCLPYAATSFSGATFYKLNYFDGTDKLYIEEVTALEAGIPYIFQATATTVTIEHNTTPEEISAGNERGLYGSFVRTIIQSNGEKAALSAGSVIIAEENAKVTVPACRAYFDMTEVPTTEQPHSAPLRCIGVPSQTPTGLGQVEQGQKTMKVLNDGQLVIIKDNKMYNAQGFKVQ